MHQDIKHTLIWMICATLVTGLAIWQAQVALTQDRRAREVALPPPVKTRHAERPTTRSAAGDPISNYQTRQEKGLTDREIRWILDDFKTAGLDLGIRTATREDYLAQRQAQDRWYRDALVEGWSLNDAQAAQVTLKLAQLSNLAKADFIEALNAGPRPFQQNGQWFNLTGTEPIYQLVDFKRRIAVKDSPSLPWSLCKLPADDFSNLENPSSAPFGQSRFLLPRAKPLEGAQVDTVSETEETRNDLLAQIHDLHPAQLKLLLLVSPDMTQDLEKLLEISNP